MWMLAGLALILSVARGSSLQDDDAFAEVIRFAERLEDENSGVAFLDRLAAADAGVIWEDYWEMVTNSQGAAHVPVDWSESDMDGDEALYALMTELSEFQPDGVPEQISTDAMREIKIENAPAIVSPEAGSTTEARFFLPSVSAEPTKKKLRTRRGAQELEPLDFSAPAAPSHVVTPLSGATSVEASVDLNDPMGNNWATEKLVIVDYMLDKMSMLPKASSVYEDLKTKLPSTKISGDLVAGFVRELASQICVPRWLHMAVMKYQFSTKMFDAVSFNQEIVARRPKQDHFYLSIKEIAAAALTWRKFCIRPFKANPELEPLWLSQTSRDGLPVMCMKAQPRRQFLYIQLLALA